MVETKSTLVNVCVASLKTAINDYLPISENIVRTNRTYEKFFETAVKNELALFTNEPSRPIQNPVSIQEASLSLQKHAMRISVAAESFLRRLECHQVNGNHWEISISAAALLLGMGNEFVRCMIENLYHNHIIEVEKGRSCRGGRTIIFKKGKGFSEEDFMFRISSIMERIFRVPFSRQEQPVRYLDWAQLQD